MQRISVIDTRPPVFVGALPQDVTVACGAVPPAATLAASDSCDADVPVTYSETVSGGSCADSYTLMRTWAAVDDCGNQAVWTQVVRVVDTIAPTLTIPADQEVTCDAGDGAATDPQATGWATATDNCDASPFITYQDIERAGDCVQGIIIERTWMALDACGNQVSAVQTIRVVDRTPPTFVVPPQMGELPQDETVQCGGLAPAALLTAIDNCDGDVPVRYSEAQSGETCADGYVLTRTWTATDDCGNETQHVQTITVRDTTPPAVTCPADVAITNEPGTCSAELPFRASANDNCSVATLRYWVAGAQISSPHAFPVGLTVVTVEATDECGNAGQCTFSVAVTDVDAPTIACPDDIIQDTDPGSCEARVDVAWPQAADNCGAPQVTGVRSDGRALTDPYPLGVTTIAWAAMDGQGNRVTCSQRVLIQDLQPSAMKIVKGGPTVAADNDKIVYTFLVTNDDVAGDGSPIYNLAVTDSLAGTASYAIGDDGDGFLEVGETWEFRAEYLVQSSDPRVVGNQVQVVGFDCDGDRVLAQDVHTLELARAALAEPFDWNDPQCAGADQRYTLVFSNTGAVALTDVVLTVWLPTTVSFNEPDSSEGLIVTGPQHGRWKIGKVLAGEIVTRHLQIHVKREMAGQVLAPCFTLDAERIDPIERCAESAVTRCVGLASDGKAVSRRDMTSPGIMDHLVTPAPEATSTPPPAETPMSEETPTSEATSTPPPVEEATPTETPVSDATPAPPPAEEATPTETLVSDATPTATPANEETPTSEATPTREATPVPRPLVKETPTTESPPEGAAPSAPPPAGQAAPVSEAAPAILSLGETPQDAAAPRGEAIEPATHLGEVTSLGAVAPLGAEPPPTLSPPGPGGQPLASPEAPPKT